MPQETIIDSRPAGPLPLSIRIGNVLLAVLRKCGIDRAVAYTLAGRSWSVIATPVSWLLISRYLRPEQQGFYYTFASLIAMNVLLELGLTGVLVQFASHEMAHLAWNSEGTLSGSDVAFRRLSALLKISLKWFGVAAGLICALLMPCGFIFFSHAPVHSLVSWQVPWVLVTIAASLNLLCLPLLAVLEGCGRVAHIASLRLGQSVVANTGLWLVLWLKGALYASPAFELTEVGFALGWLWYHYRHLFKVFFQVAIHGVPFSWKTEVWPFQWRIAVTSIGGYLTSQLFNPILFAARGPVVAGQMGMSLSVVGGLGVLAYAWIGTKVPNFGGMVATRKWKELDSLFFQTLSRSLLALSLLSACALGVVALLSGLAPNFSTRLLSALPFGFLLLGALMNHLIYCQALYLRAHKAEPFLTITVIMGALTGVATYLTASRFGASGVCIGYAVCTLLTLVLGTMIFSKKRREWHS